MVHLAALGASVTGALIALPRSVEACGPTPFVEREEVLRRDGSTGVPTNAELRVGRRLRDPSRRLGGQRVRAQRCQNHRRRL